jgi:hypothetical protein
MCYLSAYTNGYNVTVFTEITQLEQLVRSAK